MSVQLKTGCSSELKNGVDTGMVDEFENIVETYVKNVRFHGKNVNNVIFKGDHIINENQKNKILDVHRKHECNK